MNAKSSDIVRPAAPRYLDAGETMLVVEFGTTVDPALNDRVLALDAAVRALDLSGVVETVPTYRSLAIHYEPLVLDRAALVAAVEASLASEGAAGDARRAAARTLWTLPCCYDPAFAEDLAEAAAALALTPERAAALHAGAEYRVYMYGFAPGFAYLGGLPPELAIPRRATPRPPHPPNAILVAGGLTLVATVPMPTGWWVFGRTPERMFSPAREPVFLVEVGDHLRFDPVDAAAFVALDARAAAGEVVARREAVP